MKVCRFFAFLLLSSAIFCSINSLNAKKESLPKLIIRLQNSANDLFVGLRGETFTGRKAASLDTYWYVYPNKAEKKNEKNNIEIKNGEEVRLVSVINKNELGGHNWIIKLKDNDSKLIEKGTIFTLKDPSSGKYLAVSADKDMEFEGDLNDSAHWKIVDYYPTLSNDDFNTGDIVVIKCLANDAYLTYQGEEIRPHGNDLLNHLVAPTSINIGNNNKFEVIKTEDGALVFKLQGKFLHVSSRPNWDKMKWFNRFYYKTQGILQILGNSIGNAEKFRIKKGFFIESDINDGFLTYIAQVKELLGGSGFQVSEVAKLGSIFAAPVYILSKGYEAVQGMTPAEVPIVSPYSNPIRGYGDPNDESPMALFAIIKISEKNELIEKKEATKDNLKKESSGREDKEKDS